MSKEAGAGIELAASAQQQDATPTPKPRPLAPTWGPSEPPELRPSRLIARPRASTLPPATLTPQFIVGKALRPTKLMAHPRDADLSPASQPPPVHCEKGS